jgi:hypothetical protein
VAVIQLRCRFEEQEEAVSLWADQPHPLCTLSARPFPPQVIQAIRRGGVTATCHEGALGTLTTWNDGGRPIYAGVPLSV